MDELNVEEQEQVVFVGMVADDAFRLFLLALAFVEGDTANPSEKVNPLKPICIIGNRGK